MPPAQNVDSKSSSQQYSSFSNNIGNTNNIGPQRNIIPYQQHHHQQSQQSSQQNSRRPLVPPTGNAMPMASNIHQGHIGNASNNPNRMSTSTPQPTPLFERLVSEEVQEMKAYARIIENQNRRLVELERVHGDLEARLELEARGRAQLEATLEAKEREWAMKYHQLERDRDRWKDEVTKEQSKNARLIDQVVRKDQDIHRMLQRKYDNQRESGNAFIRNSRQINSERQGTPPLQTHDMIGQSKVLEQLKSPHEIIAESGSMETVRIRNVKNLLTDFFGV